ncbi:hypothetical protein AbraIFM66951_008228 [Aspergillus brasiliensis]|uniref:Uncharacterized protein n=1 Tax=Aspergillus brasiliensis TaxID=319629 RepID=A0A9W5YQ64_9EURO|nr:hypothetical protein AbraCBS73388_005228 [Aspergillus brasiliensis]GKZ45574.1 hypothetical protein AbraIFM66951_008228 [Aspergillus brasiliensis]
MKHTGWVDYCADILGQRAEYPTDQYIKALIEIQLLARQSELEVEDPTHANKDELFQSMDRLENQIERILVRQPQCNTWALRLELNAIPAIVLGHPLPQGDAHHQYDNRRLSRIARSAFNIVTVFLATPASVTSSLPMSSYTSIWYGLLVLSKLSLASDAAKDRTVEVHNRDIHNLGLAAMQKMETMSRGNDFWDNCRTVIGSMLSWLESSRKRLQSGQVRADTSNTPEAENIDSSPQGIREGSTAIAESGVTEDWDATIWQQMMQDLTWIGGIPMEQQFTDPAFAP